EANEIIARPTSDPVPAKLVIVRARGDRVVAGNDNIVAFFAPHRVAGHEVITRASVECVVPSLQQIVPRSAADGVPEKEVAAIATVAAVDRAPPALQYVVPVRSDQGVSFQIVVSGAPVNDVVPGATTDQIVPVAAIDLVITAESLDHVIARGSNDDIVPLSPH